MFDYFESQEYFIDHIWFYHDGGHYTGNGILNWNPDEGFRIAARIENPQLNLPLHKEFKALDFVSSICVYMKLAGGLRAIAPNVFPDGMGLLDGRLAVNTNRVIFIQQTTIPVISNWHGSALFEVNKKLLLPDQVVVETRIGDGEPSKSFSRAGIRYVHESGLKVVGSQKEEKYLELSWSLPKDQWRKKECWDFSEGLQNSISLLAGISARLKYREVYRANRIYREVLSAGKTSSLGLIFRPFDYNFLEKDIMIELAKFFIRGEHNADISRKIFHQMVEASLQRSHQGQELLLATILEAALRSIYKCPFDPKVKKGLNIQYYLNKFREEYLKPPQEYKRQWKRVTVEVERVYKRLRNRNAHPDWLSIQGGAYSDSEIEQTTNDMIFLSRFYGYMIKGLASSRVEAPSFPLPVAKWNPMMTIDINKPNSSK